MNCRNDSLTNSSYAGIIRIRLKGSGIPVSADFSAPLRLFADIITQEKSVCQQVIGNFRAESLCIAS